MYSPNKVLSKELHVKLLKEGEKAVFRLLNARTKEGGREEPTCPETWTLSEMQDIYDPIQQQYVTIGNVTGRVPMRENGRPKIGENGGVVTVDKMEKPVFVRGHLTVTHTQNDTFSYLMRRKDNMSNKWRPRDGKKARFELVVENKDVSSQLQIENWAYKAQKLIYEGSFSDMKALRGKLNQSQDVSIHIKSSDTDLEGMKLEMIQRTKTHAKQVIFASGDPESKASVVIYESVNFGILAFEEGDWYFQKKGGKYEKIHKADPEKTKQDSLVAFFMSEEGRPTYLEVHKELKSILTATTGIKE